LRLEPWPPGPWTLPRLKSKGNETMLIGELKKILVVFCLLCLNGVAPALDEATPDPTGNRLATKGYSEVLRTEDCATNLERDLDQFTQHLKSGAFEETQAIFTENASTEWIFDGTSATEPLVENIVSTAWGTSPRTPLTPRQWIARWRESIGTWTKLEDVSLALSDVTFDSKVCARGRAKLNLDIRGTDKAGATNWITCRTEIAFLSKLRGFRIFSLRVESSQRLLTSRPPFEEIASKVGIEYQMYDFPIETRFQWGWQGIAAADVNGDGWIDLFIPSTPRNFLFINNRKGSFEDRSKEWGLMHPHGGTGPLFFDMDNDGDQDLFVGFVSETGLKLFENTGDRFVDVSESAGIAREVFAYSAAAADVDGDGLLDFHVCCYNDYGPEVPSHWYAANNGTTNQFFHNLGSGRFEECASTRGLAGSGWSFAASFADIDGDGDADLYVANDHGENNLLVNDGKGNFTDHTQASGSRDFGQGMGVDWGDVDDDGDLDLYISNIHSTAGGRLLDGIASQPFAGERERSLASLARGNVLLLNDGGQFRRFQSGAESSGWSWGSRFFDHNNDGSLDLYVTNGFISGKTRVKSNSMYWRHILLSTPGSPPLVSERAGNHEYFKRQLDAVFKRGLSFAGFQRNHLFVNRGGGRLLDISGVSGCDSIEDGRGAAIADFDNDGDLDLCIHNVRGSRHQFFANRRGQDQHWISLRLIGSESNRDAVGAKIFVEVDGKLRFRDIRAGSGFVSCSDRRVHIGLGSSNQTGPVTIIWPTGKTQKLDPLPANGFYEIEEGQAGARRIQLGRED